MMHDDTSTGALRAHGTDPLASAVVDVVGMFDEIAKQRRFEYRDPFGPEWGEPEKMTRTQRNALAFYREREKGIRGWDPLEKKETLRPPIVAMIGAKGSGKMLANSEPVLTPCGFVPNGTLAVGDLVIGRNGEPTRVTGVFPQGVQQIVRVEMNDGTFVRASWDHLWAVQTGSQKHRGAGFVVKTTKEIFDDLHTTQGAGKWYLPELSPVEFEGAMKLPVAPYALGALIGDGGLKRSPAIFTSADEEILRRFESEVGIPARAVSRYDYSFGTPRGESNPLTAALRALGVYGKGSKQKRIPEIYLRASVADRIELLRGLMDTDGSPTASGTAEFYTSSPGLAEDVLELVRSLGGVTRIAEKKAPAGSSYEKSYRVRVALPFNPFFIERKAERYNINATQGRAKSIVRIVEDGHEHATCISVAADDCLYVTRDYNVTHNTRFGAKLALEQAQRFPGSIGVIVSNTYEQASGISAPQLVDECERLGFNVEFFREKKVHGKRVTQLYIIDLDGKGFGEGLVSYVLVRSFEAASKIEGIELDWLWAEEIQDVDWDSFRVFYTRVRGKKAWRWVYVAGMPFDDTHWMYSRLPELGATPENEIREELGMEPFEPRKYADLGLEIPETVEDYHKSKSIGMMFEPVIFENQKNLPDGEIGRLAASLDPVTFERWIYGNRTSMTTDRIAYAYEDALHRRGRASRLLCNYDPAAPLVLSIDFNTRPMCASIWQLKRWNDAWSDPELMVEYDYEGVPIFYRLHENGREDIAFEDLPPGNREVGAMIDELEVWQGGTRGLINAFLQKYGNHAGEVYVLGDATGNRDDTRSGTTDWIIIEEAVMEMQDAMVIRGLLSKSNLKTGKVHYENPPRRDTFNVLNAALKDTNDRAWIFFPPKSALKSGGAVASLIGAKFRPDGYLDDSNDKRPDETLVRTHFFDTIRYFSWWLRGGLLEPEQAEERMASLMHDTMLEGPDDEHPGGWGALSTVGSFGGF